MVSHLQGPNPVPQKALPTSIGAVNRLKIPPLEQRTFSALREGMGAEHGFVLSYWEQRWLPCGMLQLQHSKRAINLTSARYKVVTAVQLKIQASCVFGHKVRDVSKYRSASIFSTKCSTVHQQIRYVWTAHVQALLEGRKGRGNTPPIFVLPNDSSVNNVVIWGSE